MVAQGFVWLLHIQMPVADTVEAACVQSRIIERLRQNECLAKPDFCLRVVASCPQKTQVNRTLPFCLIIIHLASYIQCLAVIMLCLFKLAKCLIGLPTRTVQRGWRREGQVISSLECPGEIVDGSTVR